MTDAVFVYSPAEREQLDNVLVAGSEQLAAEPRARPPLQLLHPRGQWHALKQQHAQVGCQNICEQRQCK